MEESNQGVSVKREWLRLGLVLAFLHYVFLLLVVMLLAFDLYLAVALAIGLSIVGTIALRIHVEYLC